MADTQFLIKGDSPANGDLMFWRIIGHEVLGRPSTYELTVLSMNERIEARDILGRSFDVVIAFADAEDGKHERHCQGHAVRFTRAARIGRYFEYRITLRSWFWLLTKRINSRILQDMAVIDVLETVFENSKIKRLKKIKTGSVIGKHPPHLYCVQYQESDYRFLSRLIEEEGVYYWFDAHDAPGTMHLSDASDVAHEPLPAGRTLHYAPDSASEARFNTITRWVSMRQFESGNFASRDSDFTAISKELHADKGEPDTHELSDLEAFEFPGGYKDGDDTENLARVRLDELIGRRQRHWALTGWPDVAVGRSFEFQGDPDATRNGDYIIAGCTFVASHPGYESLDIVEARRPVAGLLREALADDPVNADARVVLEDLLTDIPAMNAVQRGTCTFLMTVLPVDMPWRPPRLTPRVFMRGPQTAIVVGKQGEEIWTEEHGRVKVQFHWDRYGTRDENSSCWVRVSHPWAGKNWGSVSIPRIGQEVIVDFLEGDPDQPIIVGRVYNSDNMAPFALPGGAVVSGLKTNTHKGKGYNEMSMDDTAGKEKITIHGQYDMNTTVEHDQTNTVNNTFTETIKSDATIKVTEGKYSHDVVANTANYHVMGALTEKYDATQTTTVKSAIAISSTGGPISISSDSQHVYINAATSIQLHVGASMIWMDSGGQIKIQGVNVAIEGSASVTIKGGIVHSEAVSEHQTKGAIVLSEGAATNTVKGGMVMLNP